VRRLASTASRAQTPTLATTALPPCPSGHRTGPGTGYRQLNAALHRIALTQVHWHPPAQAMIARRRANGDGGLEALRVLKRRLSDVVYRALHADAIVTGQAALAKAA
jgi:hypothetical protein